MDGWIAGGWMCEEVGGCVGGCMGRWVAVWVDV